MKYFKNIPRSPPIGRQALSVNFFFKFAMRSLEKKSSVAQPTGAAGGPVAPHTGDRGGLSPLPALAGDQGDLTYIRSNLPSLLI